MNLPHIYELNNMATIIISVNLGFHHIPTKKAQNIVELIRQIQIIEVVEREFIFNNEITILNCINKQELKIRSHQFNMKIV